MATIKSYTDLSQSKKLAEILPIESADMMWEQHYNNEPYVTIKPHTTIGKSINCHCCNCWSLAALLGVLPQFIKFKGDKYYLRFMKDYVEYANDEISITGRCLHTTGDNNLVDACYEMILKLHELKML